MGIIGDIKVGPHVSQQRLTGIPDKYFYTADLHSCVPVQTRMWFMQKLCSTAFSIPVTTPCLKDMYAEGWVS